MGKGFDEDGQTEKKHREPVVGENRSFSSLTTYPFRAGKLKNQVGFPVCPR